MHLCLHLKIIITEKKKKKHLHVWFSLKHVVSEGENLQFVVFLVLDFTINCFLPKVKYRNG